MVLSVLCPVLVNLDEPSQGSIVGPFHIVWEQACGELFHAPMVLDAFAADTLAAAGFIRAVANLEIFALDFKPFCR